MTSFMYADSHGELQVCKSKKTEVYVPKYFILLMILSLMPRVVDCAKVSYKGTRHQKCSRPPALTRLAPSPPPR